MKILLFSDNHFCKNSSIVRGRGTKYSLRLENQIQSLNWVEQVDVENNCDLVICLGDFFDKPVLTDEELTALKDIQWNNLHHYFIVGNHESSVNSLKYNSTRALESPIHFIVDEPITIPDFSAGLDICILPYIVESDRKSLQEYFPTISRRIILSHNDIKGLQMGSIISKEGFGVDEIESQCELFINGHIHNGTKFCKNGYNLGNLTGQNFSENAFIYKHQVAILDTKTLKMEFIENPYAFNFYKIEINNDDDFNILRGLKNNSLVSIKCKDYLVEELKQYLENSANILNYKITIVYSESTTESNYEDLTVDHLEKFVEFCKDKLGNLEIVNEELKELCK